MARIALIAGLAAMLVAAKPAMAQPPARPPAPITLNAPPLIAPPAALSPSRIGGFAFYVNDLEAQRRWYETMFGMRVRTTYQRDGKVFEYVMALDDDGPALALMTAMRPPGFNSYSRLILQAPDAKGLADYLQTRGVFTRAISPRVVVVLDPEGNQIEIFTRPAPAPG